MRRRRVLNARQGSLDGVHGIEPLTIQLQFARSDTRDVQEVGDELRLHSRVPLDGLNLKRVAGVQRSGEAVAPAKTR